MKTAYSAVTLRYVHDVVTGEFVIIGVVLLAPHERFFDARFATHKRRITSLFPDADVSHLQRVIRFLTDRFAEMKNDIAGGLPFYPSSSIAALVQRVLPYDDSSLQWSEEFAGLTDSPETTLETLFQRLVNRYKQPKHIRAQRERDITAAFLSALGNFADRLEPKIIASDLDSHTYDLAWKNGQWNCLEPVSFDHAESSRTLDKVRKLLGNGITLADAEPHKVYFLVAAPSSDSESKAYNVAFAMLAKYPTDHELVEEANLPAFAQRVAKEIEDHDRIG